MKKDNSLSSETFAKLL